MYNSPVPNYKSIEVTKINRNLKNFGREETVAREDIFLPDATYYNIQNFVNRAVFIHLGNIYFQQIQNTITRTN